MAQTLEVEAPGPLAKGFEYVYTSCYCEENVFFLCQHLLARNPHGENSSEKSNVYAVFVSNTQRKVQFWKQRLQASQASEGPVTWDYHVFVLEKLASGEVFIWDLDSTLELPCPAETYIQQALCPHLLLTKLYPRCFRVVEAHAFLQTFASDRSHMRRADGSWYQAPPSYACITSPGGAVMNLPEFLDMQVTQGRQETTDQGDNSNLLPVLPAGGAGVNFGQVLDEQQFLECTGYKDQNSPRQIDSLDICKLKQMMAHFEND